MRRPPFDAASLASLDLDPAPIRPEWILDGRPMARCRHWSDSSDGTTSAMVWDCTAGRFRWYFGGDEIVHILEGEVIVTGDDGSHRTLRPGDAALFRAGAWSTWHVPHYVRKHAICHDSLPVAIALPLRATRRVGRLFLRLREAVASRLAPHLAAGRAPLALLIFLGA
ncbi:MAG: cupin domain-containing protein [Phreatobacter sp.]